MSEAVVERIVPHVAIEARYAYDDARKLVRLVLSRLKPGDRLPGGQQLMPVDPTEAMLKAGWTALWRRSGHNGPTFDDDGARDLADIYRAMLAASGDT